jgi:riboflavin synthase alpha subunit
MKQKYFVNIRAQGFIGWNTVHAASLEDAKKQFLDKLGPKTYSEIIWENLKIGKEAEIEDQRMEKMWSGMFD